MSEAERINWVPLILVIALSIGVLLIFIPMAEDVFDTTVQIATGEFELPECDSRCEWSIEYHLYALQCHDAGITDKETCLEFLFVEDGNE